MSYYYCYSYPLKKYLVESGEHFIVAGLHETTLKKFWVFQRNEKLDELLEQWTKVK